MNIELENNSAPRLEKFFEDRPDIQGIMLDVDNTVCNTDIYYDTATYCIGMDVAKYMDNSKSSEEITREISEKVNDIYARDNYRPRVIQELTQEALMEYLGIEELPQHLQEIVNYWLKDFYLKSPELNESTITVLSDIKRCGKKIGLHSHAPDEWTGIKANAIAEELGQNIPYFTTDIHMKKDMNQWIKSCKILGIDIENVLVVGDSLNADIIPSIQAGCKHVIWIDRYGKGLPQDFFVADGVEMIIVRDIADTLSL